MCTSELPEKLLAKNSARATKLGLRKSGSGRTKREFDVAEGVKRKNAVVGRS